MHVQRNLSWVTYSSWFLALTSMLISLLFSEIFKYPPCVLCWYQRLFMYPLVFIIPVGILVKDKNIFTYTFVLSALGLIVASYHCLIYYDVIQEALKLCNAELSCKTKQFELFNFISIPLMSFTSFLIIAIINLMGVLNAKRN